MRWRGSTLKFKINKRKTLDAAARYAQKGAFDKALQEYRKVLQADPHDTQVRLRIGDLYAKSGDKAKAVEAYTQVAAHLADKGFEAKAVAIYKQILRIDPDQAEIRVHLGDLYQRLGLASDALREFQAATKRYQERGARRKAFELLRRVASLDPGNIPNRLRLTELLYREELKEESAEEYESLVRDVQSSGRAIDVIRVAEHMFQRFSDHVDALRAYAKAKIETGAPQEAIEPIRKALPRNSENIPLREALVELYEASGDVRAAQAVYREIAELYKLRGDDAKARDILQRYVPTDPLADPEADDAAEPDSDPGIVLTEEVTDSDPRATSVPTIAPEADLEIEPSSSDGAEDLLAEAKVALQFGDLQEAESRAIETLERQPLSDGARAVLADVATRQGDLANAIRLTKERQELAAVRADGDLLSEIEGQLRRYEGEMSGTAPSIPDMYEELPDVEIMLEDDEDQDPTAASVDPPSELRQMAAGGFDLEPEDAEVNLEPLSARSFESLRPLQPEPAPDLDVFDGIELKADAEEFEVESGSVSGRYDASTATTSAPIEGIELEEAREAKMELESSSSRSRTEPPAVTALQEPADAIEIDVAGEEVEPTRAAEPAGVAEELEEAEFYVEQGMLAEAERLLRLILERAPDHPHAMLRLGEIAAARGQAPETITTPPGGPPVAPPALDIPEVGPPESESPPPPAPAAREVESRSPVDPSSHEMEEIEIELDDDFEIPPEPSAPPAARKPGPAAPPAVESRPEAGRSVDLEGEDLPVDLDELLSEPTDENPFDLAAELERAVGEVAPEHDDPTTPDISLSGVAPELEELFNSFKRGIQEQLGEGESEAHYDLGIAYQEMGLVEDAIREFELASQGEERKLEALALLGACKVEAGRAKSAVEDLSRALKMAGRDAEATLGLRYELARALEACGEKDRALKAYRLVKKADPEFRDVGERIEALERS